MNAPSLLAVLALLSSPAVAQSPDATESADAPRAQVTARPAAPARFVPTHVARLELTDGRVFENARITGESPLMVTVRHSGGFAQVEKLALPEELLAKYPVDREAAARALEREEAARDKRTSADARRLSRAMDERRASVEANARRAAAEQAELAQAESRARSLAQAEAERYFRTRWKPGNTSVALTDLQVTIDTLEAKPGWPGHWNVTGSAYVEYYMSSGRSFTTTTMAFTGELDEKTTGPKLSVSVR
jgi:hypothetical protein